ncbi:MAG: glycosyltransferase [Bacteroidota bacterium]|nr:glycosyltransferase [Bacteroidota bacterium]
MKKPDLQTPKNLVLISAQYPYGFSETFLKSELTVLSGLFANVYIFPLEQKESIRNVPSNVFVSTVLSSVPKPLKLKFFFKHLLFILNVLFGEFIIAKQKLFFLKNIREFNSILCQAIQKSEILDKELKNKGEKNVHYSYWMNQGALIFSVLKAKKRIPGFVYRVHGFDLFDERRKGSYMPFRYFNSKMSDAVYTVSNAGYEYLKQKRVFAEKVRLNRLGVFDLGLNPIDQNNIFTLVSCSNLIPLKRVALIIDALKHIEFPLKWVHIGDGYQKQKLLEKAKSIPANVQYEFKGAMSNEKVLEFYQTNSINLFILLSETEGGVSIVLQEAASFGIPLLGTNAGGIPEIVNESTGILVKNDVSSLEVAHEITKFKSSFKNSAEFRNQVRKYWKDNFDASKTYKEFYYELSGCKK